MQAIYARQSVEKIDSISIEMQIQQCKRICRENDAVTVWKDSGFSGTTTARPAFQQMMEQIRSGKIQEVYVYKLDRISRSLCDFAAMMRLFRKKGVTLYSVQERFDTQTETGGILLHLLMMFAEMEQKTIAARVKDNYYARAKRQMPLGGIAPYGYRYNETGHDLVTEETERENVVAIYLAYGVKGWNVEQIVQSINRQGKNTRTGHHWSNAGVLRILRNPVYVRGNYSVVQFLQKKGAVLEHPTEWYCHNNGYVVYGDPHQRQGLKFSRWEGEHVTAGRHLGIIDSSLWLAVQERLDWRGGACNRGTGSCSWIQGLVTCGLCGTRCYARNNGKGAMYTYFVCRGKRLGICTGIGAVQTHRVESCVAGVLRKRGLELLAIETAGEDAETISQKDAIALGDLEQRIHTLLGALSSANVSKDVIQAELERLVKEKKEKETTLRVKKMRQERDVSLFDWDSWWKKAPLSVRRQTAGMLLEEVRLYPSEIQIQMR